ncbi:MAG: NAD(P)/FAD-dependent oxidoreductase [Actinomycetota bacterium]|nr:NAD(P)/FAD-dependent oxidoreductase [Actinomycetota bacterium]
MTAADESPTPSDAAQVVIIGAGPAGLTAAHELGKRGATCTVLEADTVVGGISRTVERDGWRFDIGGHRFFTKVPEVEARWKEILPDDFIRTPRLSRILYRGKLFDYPLKAGNALKSLGVLEAIRCLLSYVWVRLRPPRDQTNFEGWTASRFGWRLYRIFFKTYTEKVWGVPADQITADWAAQRIKNLSLTKAVWRAIFPGRGKTDITSLIDEFDYPKLGPGQMWERCTELVTAAGSEVVFNAAVARIERDGGRATTVHAADGRSFPCSAVISSMPLGELVLTMDPPAPAEVQAAAKGLTHRDHLLVALVVPEAFTFPDNWIYVHEPGVLVGRVQNFGSWSPHMVKEGRTCLGLEYFVFEGDELWASSDEELVDLGAEELARIGLVTDPSVVEAGYVTRMSKAYPTYDEHYAANVDVCRAWLATEAANVHPVGRNGMHRYNNQDHSMVTALRTVDNLFGDHHDVWAVNVEEEYHEETRVLTEVPTVPTGTGRSAPIIPRRD